MAVIVVVMNNVDNQKIDEWIGHRVNQIIEDDGFKVKAIATKIGMPLKTFASKRGGESSFTFSEIYKIAEATHHAPGDFLPPLFDVRHAQQEVTHA